MDTTCPAIKASSVDSRVNTSTSSAMPKYSSTASAMAAGQTSHARFFGSGAIAGNEPASFIFQNKRRGAAHLEVRGKTNRQRQKNSLRASASFAVLSPNFVANCEDFRGARLCEPQP